MLSLPSLYEIFRSKSVRSSDHRTLQGLSLGCVVKYFLVT
jgi:hypothetical protein